MSQQQCVSFSKVHPLALSINLANISLFLITFYLLIPLAKAAKFSITAKRVSRPAPPGTGL